MKRFVALAVSLTLACVACDAPSRSETPLEATGVIEISIGPDIKRIGFSDVECTSDTYVLRGTRKVRTRAATNRIPDVLVAKRVADGVEATVFDFSTQWASEEYDTLMVLAQRADGMPRESECQLVEDAATMTLECSNATPIPWHRPGGPPAAQFRVLFECPP